MPRGGKEKLESQFPWPWVFRRNHGFPTGWEKGLEGNGNRSRQGMTRRHLIKNKDTNVLGLFPFPSCSGNLWDSNREETGGVSPILAPSSSPNLPI